MTRSRKASGESSIYRDDEGRWHGFVSLGLTDNGRRDRRHGSGGRRKVVVDKLRALEVERDAGVAQAAGRSVTLTQWLDYWLKNVASRKVRPSTLEGYESKVRTRIVPLVGHHRLDQLQPEHVETMLVRLEAEGLSPATVLQCHRILSRAMKVAMQRGRIAQRLHTGRRTVRDADRGCAVHCRGGPLHPDGCRVGAERRTVVGAACASACARARRSVFAGLTWTLMPRC